MTRLTPDEMFAAGHSGTYLQDPKTGKRTLIETKPTTTTTTTAAAPKDGQVRS